MTIKSRRKPIRTSLARLVLYVLMYLAASSVAKSTPRQMPTGPITSTMRDSHVFTFPRFVAFRSWEAAPVKGKGRHYMLDIRVGKRTYLHLSISTRTGRFPRFRAGVQHLMWMPFDAA